MRRSSLAAALAIVLVLGCSWSRTRPAALNVYDQPFYLGIAFDLLHHGRFTDGYRFAGGDAATERPASMRFAPLYPALLAAAAAVDPRMRADMDCLVATGDGAGCGRRAAPIRFLQFLMLSAVFWLVWWQAAAATGRVEIGWLALALLLPAAPLLLRSVDTLMTEMTALCLCVAAEAAALLALVRPPPRGAAVPLFAAGALAALACLCRPGLEPLCTVLAAGGLSAALVRRRRAGPFRRAGWCFGLAYALALSPWLVRNAVEFGRLSLTFGYASHTFVQRLSFDSMGWPDWGRAFLCWLPDGSGLGTIAFGDRHACDRFGWDDHPDSFYSIGLGTMLAQTLHAAGGWSHHGGYLLRTYLLADPLRQIPWHLAVSLPLLERGLGVNHWWGVALGGCCAARLLVALRRRNARDRCFLLLALPPLALLVLDSLIAVNQPRYNLLLVLPFSVSGALPLARLVRVALPAMKGVAASLRPPENEAAV